MANKLKGEWEWIHRKQAVYCRPHGRRIIVIINGIGGCRKCVDDLIKKIQERA